MIESRVYRNFMGDGRFVSFTTGYKDTDLWIGVSPGSFHEGMKDYCFDRVKQYRLELENYLFSDPQFGRSLKPYQPISSSPELASIMAAAGKKAGVGPMAAVAGAFAEQVGNEMLEHFQINELAIENGGDIFLYLTEPLTVSVYAGNDPLSGRIGLEVPKEIGKIGFCTSSGKLGPSLSFGKADAVMVACKETALADAWATSLGNRVQNSDDIDEVLRFSENIREILSVVIICDGKVGIRGNFEMKIIG